MSQTLIEIRQSGTKIEVTVRKSVLSLSRRQLSKVSEKIDYLLNFVDDVAEKEYQEGDYEEYGIKVK